MELYTSLTRLKQAMNGGQMPPMTPVPEKVHHLIDPAFTIGLGALEEDAEKGLRCPIRGCGEYHHLLSSHLKKSHKALGGADAVRRALSIPKRAPLVSHAARDRLAGQAASGYTAAGDRFKVARAAVRKRHARDRGRSVGRTRTSMMVRNLQDRCYAQLSHKLIDLQHRIGRPPSIGDARTEIGDGFVHAVVNTFGTWNSALLQCGMEARQARRKPIEREAVLAALSAWHEAHGTLPSCADVQARARTPVTPEYRTICRAMGTDSWPDAMQRAASLLNIYGGRYGLPVKREPAA